MTSGDYRMRLDLAACSAVEMMDDLIEAMEIAAEQIADGEPPQGIDVSKYQLYMASDAKGDRRAVVCIWDADDCFELICSAASKVGICLEETTRLDIKLPAAELGEDMTSGGFDSWKGISVDMSNDPLEDLLELICKKLKGRRLTLRCTEDEEVIFYLPVQERI